MRGEMGEWGRKGENRKDRLDEDSAGTKTSLLLPCSERARYIGVSLPRPIRYFRLHQEREGPVGKRCTGVRGGTQERKRERRALRKIELRAQDRI